MNKTYAYLAANTLLTLALLNGCSSTNLSRPQARNLIAQKYPKLKPGYVKDVPTVLLWTGVDKSAVPGFDCEHPGLPVTEDRKAAIPAGIIHETVLKPCETTQLELDPAFKPFIAQLSDTAFSGETFTRLKLGTYKEMEITGIVQDGSHARIEARLVFDANPVAKRFIAAKVAPDREYEIDDNPDHFYSPFNFTATRYDDGWRLDEAKE